MAGQGHGGGTMAMVAATDKGGRGRRRCHGQARILPKFQSHGCGHDPRSSDKTLDHRGYRWP